MLKLERGHPIYNYLESFFEQFIVSLDVDSDFKRQFLTYEKKIIYLSEIKKIKEIFRRTQWRYQKKN